jgi:hypothetical protein
MPLDNSVMMNGTITEVKCYSILNDVGHHPIAADESLTSFNQ